MFFILSILLLLTDILDFTIDFGDLLLLLRDLTESVLEVTECCYFQIIDAASNALLSDEPQCFISTIFFGEISTISLLVLSLLFKVLESFYKYYKIYTLALM